MFLNKFSGIVAVLLIAVPSLLSAQQTDETSLNSITKAELRDHIFFLASDYLAGRVGPSAEYEIAAQYVATQFATAGIEPVILQEDGSNSFFQGVPFTKTTYSEEISWTILKDGKETTLAHNDDFRILFGNSIVHNNLEIVYVGYGIEEPGYKWNDFKGLDVQGKIMVCLGGAPVKKGESVLPAEVHQKYAGPRGFQLKVSGLFSKGAAGIILVDIDGSTGIPFAMIPSEFATEKYVYAGGETKVRSQFMSSLYLAKPEFVDLIMAGSKNNPLKDPENVLDNYKPQLLKDTYLNTEIEILGEEIITTRNVVGMVPGTDPSLRDEYIIVGAHLDHVKPFQGQVCNGADDNASGTSGVMEIAEAIAMNPCKRSVVFTAYTAEEMGLFGSLYFVNSGLFPKEQLKFNINLDMIGRSDPDNVESRAHYVVTHKKYVEGIKSFVNEVNDSVTDFPLIYDNDDDSPGGSDHQTFINEGIPAFFFFSGMHPDLHQPGDDADRIDYEKAESISRLACLIATKLANMNELPDFINQ